MRVVLDINVIVSGIISEQGPPGQLLTLWRERQFQLIASASQIDRMSEVIVRPRLERYLDRASALAVVEDIRQAATIVKPMPGVDLTPDPEDNVILATAMAGQADLLVTGDTRHLLPLESVGDVQIVSPRDAVDAFFNSCKTEIS